MIANDPTNETGCVVGLRQRKKAQTRQALVDAALDLFTRQGFDHTTVDEIAAACDVSRRTFFRYFSSKEDVFSGDKGQQDQEIFDFIASRPAEEPGLLSLRAAVLSMASFYAEQKNRLLVQVRVINATPALQSAGHDHQQLAVEHIVDALSRRSSEPLDDEQIYQLRLVAQAAVAALRTAMDRWVQGDGQEDLVDLASQALDLLASGFRQANPTQTDLD